MSLGFECRNKHLERAPNEEYTKLYVFQISDEAETDKVTHGPFEWGKNYGLFFELEKMKILFEEINRKNAFLGFEWIQKPSETQFVAKWKLGDYLFLANLNANNSLKESFDEKYELVYATADFTFEHECQVYKEKV
jgi:hypothetical protein